MGEKNHISVMLETHMEFRCQFGSVKSFSHVWLFATPWTAVRQSSQSITSSWSLLKLMSIESVVPSNHLILCCPRLLLPSIFPASGSFQMSHFFTSGGQSIGVSASASVLPMMSVSLNKVLLEHRHIHSFLCATTVEVSSFNRLCPKNKM